MEANSNYQIVSYIEEINLFNSTQFRYRSGLGTVKAATYILGYCLQGLDSKEMANTTLFDLSKVFNMISHSLIINKIIL